MKKIYPTYDELHIGSVEIARQLKTNDEKVDYVLGITRGGLIPATIIAYQLDLPLLTISYSTTASAGEYAQSGRKRNQVLPEFDLTQVQNLLIVDDLVDTGCTLDDLYHHYHTNRGFNVKTAVLYHKLTSIFAPNYFWKQLGLDYGWITFPYEVID